MALHKFDDDSNKWYRYWPLILTLAGLIGWGYVTAYRVNAAEAMIEKNRACIEDIQITLAEINLKLGILIDRQERVYGSLDPKGK
jgi:hypothetical protein